MVKAADCHLELEEWDKALIWYMKSEITLLKSPPSPKSEEFDEYYELLANLYEHKGRCFAGKGDEI